VEVSEDVARWADWQKGIWVPSAKENTSPSDCFIYYVCKLERIEGIKRDKTKSVEKGIAATYQNKFAEKGLRPEDKLSLKRDERLAQLRGIRSNFYDALITSST
jgi:hypothetical protein